MNYKKYLMTIALCAGLLAGCSPSSSPSVTPGGDTPSGEDDKPEEDKVIITKQDWDNAFSIDKLNNLTSALTYTQNEVNDGASLTSVVKETDRFDGEKFHTEGTSSAVYTYDTVALGMSEDDVTDLIYYYAVYNGLDMDVSEDGVYTFTASSDSEGYLAPRDELTHYEYEKDDDNVYHEVSYLYSFSDILAENIMTYQDFMMDFASFTYNQSAQTFSAKADPLATFLNEHVGSGLTNESLTFTFNRDKEVTGAHLSYQYETLIVTYDFTMKDYGTTKVTLPSDAVTCDHEGARMDQSYDNYYHFDVCSHCGSVLNPVAHDFDGEGTCTVCGDIPYIEYTLYFGEGYDTHVVLPVSTVTLNPLGIEIDGMDVSTDWDFDTGAVTYTYSCEDCPLVIVEYYISIKNEDTCEVTTTDIYTFYNTNGEKIMNDLFFKSVSIQHSYDEEEEQIDDCQVRITYECEDCGDTYYVEKYDHQFVTVTYDENTYSGSVRCKACGFETEAELLGCTDEDSLAHEMFIDYYLGDTEYSQYYYECHINNGERKCTVCGDTIRLAPVEASACRDAFYGYHYFAYLDEDGFTAMIYDIEDMDEYDLDDDGRLTEYACDYCGLKIESVRGYEGQCTRTFTDDMKLYNKAGEEVGHYQFTRTETSHTWADESETTCNVCEVTKTTHCLYCDATWVVTYYDHDYQTTCTVDEDGTHHVHTECSRCHDSSDEDYDDHNYQHRGYFDGENHCVEMDRLDCPYCEKVFARTYSDFQSHGNETSKVIFHDDTYGDLAVYTCSRCGDFDRYEFSVTTPECSASEDGDTKVYDYGCVKVTITTSETAYNGNECARASWKQVSIVNADGEELYHGTALSYLYFSHVDGCTKTHLGSYGGFDVYQYDCGYVSIE